MASGYTEEIQTILGRLVFRVSPEENVRSSTSSIVEKFDSASSTRLMTITLNLHVRDIVTLSLTLNSDTGPERRVSIEDCPIVANVNRTFENDQGDLLKVKVKLSMDHIFMILLDGQRLQIGVNLTRETVASLKSKTVKLCRNVSPNAYMMTFGNFELAPDNRLLTEFDIVHGSEITLRPPLLHDQAEESETRQPTDSRAQSPQPSTSAAAASSSKAPPTKKPRTVTSTADLIDTITLDAPPPATPSTSNASQAPPTTGNPPPPRYFSGKSQHCFCRKMVDNNFMLCCPSCSKWFHGKCVNLKQEQYDAMLLIDPDYVWTCPVCLQFKIAQI